MSEEYEPTENEVALVKRETGLDIRTCPDGMKEATISLCKLPFAFLAEMADRIDDNGHPEIVGDKREVPRMILNLRARERLIPVPAKDVAAINELLEIAARTVDKEAP